MTGQNNLFPRYTWGNKSYFKLIKNPIIGDKKGSPEAPHLGLAKNLSPLPPENSQGREKTKNPKNRLIAAHLELFL